MTFTSIYEQEAREVVPGYRGVFVHSEHMTIVYWTIDPQSEMPEHSHPHEQIYSLVEGEFELNIKGERRVLGSGSMAVIPSGVVHSGKSITACTVIDAFYPVREEYR